MKLTQPRHPWIHSAPLDCAFILAPALLATLAVELAPAHGVAGAEVPLWVWGVLVVGIDVAHVYSTLYRTYLDPTEMRDRRALYTCVPLLGWITGVMLYSHGAETFWRVFAYLAVYHFVRQQYGFMMIYGRADPEPLRRFAWIDRAAIYLSTLYPLIYWHTHLPRSFHWFVDGDFTSLTSQGLERTALAAYITALSLYAAKELFAWLKWHALNLPRNLLLAGTAVSWYVGIVRYDNDLAFTATNVIAHGIPYMTLVWAYGEKKASQTGVPRRRLPWFIALLLGLAFLEEGLWDGLVWREHLALFPGFSWLPQIDAPDTLTWLVPLLALPQLTHYILDGFIWRIRKGDARWTNVVFRPQGVAS